jgi:hypothetical protein
MPVALAASLAVLAVRRPRTGWRWLAVTLGPFAVGLVVYAPLVDRSDYWYLMLAPSAAVAVAGAMSALAPGRRWRAAAGWLALAVMLAVQPARFEYSRAIGRLPHYGALVKGSQRILASGVRPRAITAAFPLETTDPAFIFTVLGGVLDPRSGTEAEILPGGGVVYRRGLR